MRVKLTTVASFAALLISVAPVSANPVTCPGNPDGLGVSRTVEIDTTGGPAFGLEQYKVHDFLQPKEIVLTFDDGPQVNTTHAILAALAAHCTKATFFSIGKMALGMPEILRDVVKAGHTVGTHTWSHADLHKKSDADAKAEIEKGISGVKRALGNAPLAPFFRFPYLRDSPSTMAHLASRNIAAFSMDVDSFDFKFHNTEKLVKLVMDKLEKKGRGIVLMHDIQPGTAKALPAILNQLRAGGYKVVHLRAKDSLNSLPDYDKLIEKDVKGLPTTAGNERPTSSVVKTISGN